MLHTAIGRSEISDRHGSAYAPGLWTRIIIQVQVVPRSGGAGACGMLPNSESQCRVADGVVDYCGHLIRRRPCSKAVYALQRNSSCVKLEGGRPWERGGEEIIRRKKYPMKTGKLAT